MVAVALLALATPARAQSPDERYVQIYGLIEHADGLNAAGQKPQAAAKYLEAQAALQSFRAMFPSWNERVVTYRLGYVAAKLEQLPPQALPAGTAPPVMVETPAPGAPPPSQMRLLQDEIARLTSANQLLEAKLKEALSVQPAAVDPHELTKAEERIRELQKERDLLKASLDQAQGRMPKPAESVVDEERKIVAELRDKLAQQAQLVASLQAENEQLKTRLAAVPGPAGTPSPAPTGDLAAQLAESRAAIAALQATNLALRTDQILLQNQVASLSREATTRQSNRQLERERDDLKKKLDAANKKLARKGKLTAPADESERERELQSAMARLEVFEARAVPYTPEELALLKQADLRVNLIEPGTPLAETARRKPMELPPGAGPIMEEGRRALDNGRFAEAEKKFVDVLRQDERNVYVMGHLAAAQMEQNRLADAEATLKKALALEPQDPACLYVMGWLKFNQEKLDEAFEALSLSARLAPEEPRTQYLLGKTLVRKGQRAAAETALRKAVQLRPNWGEAHYSLAVVYASQNPPFKELAQWHYNKAISASYPRNPDFEKMLSEKTSAAAAK
jgi:tetratricopeptide (TPR) repeat protein